MAAVATMLEAVFENSLEVKVSPEGVSANGSRDCSGDGRYGIDGSV